MNDEYRVSSHFSSGASFVGGYDCVVDYDRSQSNDMTTISVPDWAFSDSQDYIPVEASKCGIRFSKRFCIVMVKYSPKRTLGVGYSKVFIVETSTNKPFPRMKEIWNEIHKRCTNSDLCHTLSSPTFVTLENSLPDGVVVSPDGEIRNAFGVPDPKSLTLVAMAIKEIYREWRNYPNETSYEMVKELNNAKGKVAQMHMSVGGLEESIADARNSIQEYQKRIQALESQMNKLYEDAADAMNLLEEHGVKVNVDGKCQQEQDDDEYDLLDQLYVNPNYFSDRGWSVGTIDNSICYATTTSSH